MTFTGRVACRRSEGAACVTLDGRDERGRPVHLTMVGAAPAELPGRLDSGIVETLDGDRYRISDGRRAWVLAARGYLHYDVTAAFYAAIPPRRPALTRRLLWRIVLAGAASGPGRWWLKHTRR